MKHLPDLIFWVKEREKMRKLKELGAPPPWTSDAILANYRFCNVYREHDKVTKWIHENWISPNLDSPNLVTAVAIARLVNLPETLAEIEFPHQWEADKFIRVFESRKLRGLKSWTSAYMITGGYSKGGETKEVIIARVVDQLHQQIDRNPIVEGDTLESASHKVKVPGVGTFLVGQIIADLKHTPLLGGVPDWYSWCAIGPGSTAGLNYLYEREPCNLSEAQFRKEVNHVQDLIFASTGLDLCAQNAQNVLCEFSKYVRTRYYGGRPKATYIPS